MPTGTVTFLFTDIEGSARLWDEHPEEMRTALARHEVLLKDAIGAHRGHVFKMMGDEFCVAFGRASDALDAALDAQRALQAEPWEPAEPLRVRMALHTGEAEERSGDYFGPPLNRCARIRDAAHGGQVLLSRMTAQLVREALPSAAELRPLGEHRLRDLAQPEGIFQLLHPDLPGEFPRPRSLAAFTHNLPIQVTSFIGREQELKEVKRLLRTTRLLTLTGTGGAGKTRLALQAGADLLDEYPDGVWLMELAPVADASLVPQAVLSALGLREEPQRSLTDTLIDALRPKRALLILDNCEHVVEAVAQLAEALLTQSPGLRLLATSREVLRAAGEVVWRVPSLSVPPEEPDRRGPVEQTTQYEAVRLFVERAVAASPGFRVTDKTAPVLAEVCRRLDGIPLAIELAAARAQMLSPEQIRGRLDDRFRLLTGGRRTALPRQQTLRAAVAWSYDLLAEEERALFGRLSVFAGGLSLDGAEAVCAGDGIETGQVLDLLTGLVQKSLTVPEEGTDGIRYHLLETLRAYGAEQLGHSDEAEVVERRHAEFYTAFAERAEAELTGPEQATSYRRLETEHGNLRAALAWALREDATLGFRLANALARFWDVRCHWAEGREWLAQCLRGSADVAPQLRADALVGAGALAQNQNDAEAAGALTEEALLLSRRIGYAPGVASALGNQGLQAHRRGEYGKGRELWEETLAIRQELGDEHGIARCLHNLGLMAHEQQAYPTAERLYEESLAIARRRGDRAGTAMTLNNLGNVAREQGDYEVARGRLEEALAIRQQLGDKAGTAGSLANLGLVAQQQGDYETALAHTEEALGIARQLGARSVEALQLNNLGVMCKATGDDATARCVYEQALTIWRELGDRLGMAQTLGNLGLLFQEEGNYDAARPYLEESLALGREIGETRCLTNALNNLGNIAKDLGDSETARSLHEEALAIRRDTGDRAGIAMSLVGLGGVHAAAGAPEAAEPLYEEALAICRGIGDATGEAEAVQALGHLALTQGDAGRARELLTQSLTAATRIGLMLLVPPGLEALATLSRDSASAARLFGASSALRRALAYPVLRAEQAEYDRQVAALREALGEEAFRTAWQAGDAMTAEEAIREAIAACPDEGTLGNASGSLA